MQVNVQGIRRRSTEAKFYVEQINIRKYHLTMNKKTERWVKDVVTKLIILRNASVPIDVAVDKIKDDSWGCLAEWVYNVQQSWLHISRELSKPVVPKRAEELFLAANREMIREIAEFVWNLRY